MTEPLFRKEAIAHRSRSLYGDVVLRSSLSMWVLIILILAIFLLGLVILFLTQVDGVSLFTWLQSLKP